MSTVHREYTTAEDVQEAYLDEEIGEDELEELLDDPDLHVDGDDDQSTTSEVMDAIELNGWWWKNSALMGAFVMWTGLGTVFGTLAEAPWTEPEPMHALHGLFLALTPLFFYGFYRLVDDVLAPATDVSRFVKHGRYLLSIAAAVAIFVMTRGTVAEGPYAEATQIHESIGLVAAVLCAFPAVMLYVEDNADEIANALPPRVKHALRRLG